MPSLIFQGVLLGLATWGICAASCLPILGPLMLGEKRRLRTSLGVFLEFMLGRLAGYLLFGVTAGYVGGLDVFHQPGTRSTIFTAYIVLGGAMLLFAAHEGTRPGHVCNALSWVGRHVRFPFVLGFLLGINLCPPFIVAITATLGLGGALRGAAYFLGFFLGTSLYMTPCVLLGLASASRVMRSVGKIACAAWGMVLITAGAQHFLVKAPEPMRLDIPQSRVVQSKYGANPTALRAVLPAATHFSWRQGQVGCWEGFMEEQGGRGRVAGYAFVTTEIVPGIQGYGGPVPVLVGMDRTGRIVGVRMLPNNETPEYTRGIYSSRFLNQFAGKTCRDPFVLGRDIDGVTGATVTSAAVANGVRAASRIVAERCLGLEAQAEASTGWAQAVGNPIHYLIVALFATAAVGHWLRLSWLRYVTMAAAIPILGFWGRSMVSVMHFVDLFTGRIPWSAARVSWYLLLIPALVAAFLVGRLYCGWLCPFGALTELLGRLVPFKLRVSERLDRRLRAVKYFVLIAAPILFLANGRGDALAIEPFSAVFTLSFLNVHEGAGRLVWVIFLGIASLASLRFFCKYLCPAGAAMAFVSRFRVLPMRMPAGCRRCGKCTIQCDLGGGDFDGEPNPGLHPDECFLCEACTRCPKSGKNRPAAGRARA